MQENTKLLYVSITGLKAKNFFMTFLFWRNAIPSKFQAENSNGLVFLDVKRVKKYHCTLSVWKDRESMIAYRGSGAHAGAMNVFRKIATGKVYGYQARSIPTWEEALRLWAENARDA